MKLAIEIIVGVSFFLVAWGIPFFYVLRTGKFGKGVFLTWGLSIVFFVVITIPVYELIWYYDEELTAGLPEGNSIVASIFMGWLPGIIVAAAASLTRRAIKHFWPSTFSSNKNQEQG